MGMSIGVAIVAVADRLRNEQATEGINAGIWPGQVDFTGSIVAGMVGAYERTCDSAYRGPAELGGDYILWDSAGNFYGDEAFALTRLSEIASDPCDNAWRTAVSNFYVTVKHEAGTQAYISQFAGAEPSTAVFYLANHVVAAYYVDAEDKQIWREGLIDRLAQVDDFSDFPVMGLGVVTWALALSGPLDETLIDPAGTGAPYWGLKELADLPDLLLSHQLTEPDPNAGSFYWRFDHGDGGSGDVVSGYTEDAIFATLGLVGLAAANPDLDLKAAILAACQALLQGVGSDGKVYWHLSQRDPSYYVYAGEMLQVLGELIIPGDLNLDGSITLTDYAIFANNWRASNCTGCSWCDGADLDHDGKVNCVDVVILANNWLGGVDL